MAAPESGCHLTPSFLEESVDHHSPALDVATQTVTSLKRGTEKPRRLRFRVHDTVLSGRLCGKCALARARVMWRLGQVLEASFHCVTFWNHPGLPARPSAVASRSTADEQAASRSVSRPSVTIENSGSSLFRQRAGRPPARPPASTWLHPCDSRGGKQE